MFRTFIMALALVATVALWPAPAADAHAAFVTSDPPPDSAVEALPARLTIVFSGTVMRAGTEIIVAAPDGTTISDVTEVADNTASVMLMPAGDGAYTVQWKNVSADDGHEESGSFSFTVAANAR